MSGTKFSDISEVICSLDKIEAITKILSRNFFENCELDRCDTKNLYSVLLREVIYSKAKLAKFEENSEINIVD